MISSHTKTRSCSPSKVDSEGHAKNYKEIWGVYLKKIEERKRNTRGFLKKETNGSQKGVEKKDLGPMMLQVSPKTINLLKYSTGPACSPGSLRSKGNNLKETIGLCQMKKNSNERPLCSLEFVDVLTKRETEEFGESVFVERQLESRNRTEEKQETQESEGRRAEIVQKRERPEDFERKTMEMAGIPREIQREIEKLKNTNKRQEEELNWLRHYFQKNTVMIQMMKELFLENYEEKDDGNSDERFKGQSSESRLLNRNSSPADAFREAGWNQQPSLPVADPKSQASDDEILLKSSSVKMAENNEKVFLETLKMLKSHLEKKNRSKKDKPSGEIKGASKPKDISSKSKRLFSFSDQKEMQILPSSQITHQNIFEGEFRENIKETTSYVKEVRGKETERLKESWEDIQKSNGSLLQPVEAMRSWIDSSKQLK